MEWAKRLTEVDIRVLNGKAPYRYQEIEVAGGLKKGKMFRYAPEEDVRQLQQLAGHLQAGLFITKFRKLFTRAEMAEDLVIVPARVGEQEDHSEYEEILPTSPP